MPKDRFNKEMDDYIRSKRRRKNTNTTVSRSKESGISINYDGPSFWEKLKSFFEPVEPEEEGPKEELSEEEMEKLKKTVEDDEPEVMIEDEHGELQVPRPSFFDRLLSMFGFVESPEPIDDFDPDEFAIDESERVMYEEDVKEVIRIAHTWIEQLPAKKKKAFKESADFERYQDLLDKLGLLAKRSDVSLDKDLK